VPDANDLLTGFADEQSFGLFMEGLRSLQQYEDEATQLHPQKTALAITMHSATASLRECTSRYPDDLLPAFYLGVALGMRNQEVYVQRLVELKSEVTACGRWLAYEDEARELATPRNAETPVATAERDGRRLAARERARENKALAQPFGDLNERPWPLLEEASRLFDSLTKNPVSEEFASVATYNLAQVWARRGSRAERHYLSEAVSILAAQRMPDLATLRGELIQQEQALASMSRFFQFRRRPYLDHLRSLQEKISFCIQFDALRESLNIRLAALSARFYFERALASARDVDAEINSIDTPSLDPGFKADLRADYLTKMGYAYYEFAFNRDLHDFILAHPALITPLGIPARSSPSAHAFLNLAAANFTMALELKDCWNPAQIYLALVRQIQVGVAEARKELLEQDKKASLGPFQTRLAACQRDIDSVSRQERDTLDDTESRSLAQQKVKLIDQRDVIKAAIEPLAGDFDRRIADTDRDKQLFSREADALFAALQGLPWPPPPPQAGDSKFGDG